MVPVNVPERVWPVVVALKVTKPVPAVNVPLFDQLPPKVIEFDPGDNVPAEVMVILPTTVQLAPSVIEVCTFQVLPDVVKSAATAVVPEPFVAEFQFDGLLASVLPCEYQLPTYAKPGKQKNIKQTVNKALLKVFPPIIENLDKSSCDEPENVWDCLIDCKFISFIKCCFSIIFSLNLKWNLAFKITHTHYINKNIISTTRDCKLTDFLANNTNFY